jgi:ATP-binding protein involved in chromosome partitioning
MIPTKLKVLDKNKLQILWSDGSEDVLLLKDLRKFCPCATCLAEREKQSKMFIPIFSDNQVTAKTIKQVGNYAIQIEWNDGHNTGIYEYKFLRNFTKKVKV